MRIRIISIGKIKNSFVLAGEEEFLTRLQPHMKVERLELESSSNLPEAQAKEREGELLLKQLKKGDYFVVLDEKGKASTSPQFAELIQAQMNRGHSTFVFAIGGFHGLAESVKKRADRLMSLSSLTFTYQMSRLILIEQLYRALTLMKGMPYHKSA